MSDNLTKRPGPVNPEPAQKVKHTLLWEPEVWDEMERAAAKLSTETGAEVTVPNYIRGTIERRNREVLGAA